MSYFRYIYKITYLLSPVYIASSKNVCQTPCAPYALRLIFRFVNKIDISEFFVNKRTLVLGFFNLNMEHQIVNKIKHQTGKAV